MFFLVELQLYMYTITGIYKADKLGCVYSTLSRSDGHFTLIRRPTKNNNKSTRDFANSFMFQHFLTHLILL